MKKRGEGKVWSRGRFLRGDGAISPEKW